MSREFEYSAVRNSNSNSREVILFLHVLFEFSILLQSYLIQVYIAH